MNQVQANHPRPEELASFARGELNDPSLSQIAEHLGQCSSCSSALKEIPDDRLASLARAAAKSRAVVHGGSAAATASVDQGAIPAALRVLDRYRVNERIGCGGMGDVFRAEHKLMQRSVALKVINQKLTKDREAMTRFRNEVRAAAALAHPNIVSSYDADNVGDLHFLVMELVDGQSLSQHVAEHGVLSIERAVDFIEQASRGLQAAFEKGMVHRDIKPQNLILTRDGTVKILDLGLARFQRQQLAFESKNADIDLDAQALIATSAGITGTNLAIGTPDYLAPEQARDATNADTRSDIYSLGCTLHFLLTGQPLFPNGNALEKIAQHLMSQPAEVNSIRPEIPTPVTKLLSRMIEKDPKARFQTPADLLEAIEKVKIETGIPTTGTAFKTGGNRRTFIAAGLLIAFGGLAAFVGAIWMGQPPKVLNALVIAPTGANFNDLEAVKGELSRRQIAMTTAAFTRQIEPVSEAYHEPFGSDLLLSEVQVDNYDAIVFIGGNNISQLTNGEAAVETARIVSEAREMKVPLGGICMGIDILKSCQVEEVREMLENATDERIATFDGIVTAVHTEDAEAFVGRLFESAN